MRHWKKARLLVIVLTLLAVYYMYVHYQYATTEQSPPEEIRNGNLFKQNDCLAQENSNLQMSAPEVTSTCESLTKWVVLTLTTSSPTATVHCLLSNLIADWCVLVVGDDKSPDELSLNSNRFIYLSMSKQSSLPFEVVGKTPKHSICRKNIGYLYAIMNGAKVILDLDSDSIPIPLEGTYLPIEEQKAPFIRPVLEEDMKIPVSTRKEPPKHSESIVWNPYQSDTARPRGFPIDYKQLSIKNTYSVTTKTCYPIIQHFLDSNTSKHASTKVALPHAVFAPYDTRSTVHLHEAFWSLLLPKTVGSDVWRSYIAQSLLYLIPDACVMFTSLAVYHQQNHLNNHDDRNPENPNITCELLNSLRYLPLRFDTFEDALSLIYGHLHKEGILDLDDVEYVRAWIRDLKGVGYSFPKLPDKSRLWTKNIQLCIMYNHVPGEYYVRELMAYYLRFFDNIMLLFDGEWPEKPSFIPEYVNFSECISRHGAVQHKCLRTCLTSGARNVEGYLFVADDIFVNLSRMSTLPRSKLWFVGMGVYDYTNQSAFTHWRWPNYFKKTQLVVDNLPPEWKEVLVKFVGFPKRFHGNSFGDILYVPQPMASHMVEVLSYIINTTDLFCEIAIPLAVDIVDPQYVHMDSGYLMSGNRKNRIVITSTAAKAPFVHPLKLAIRPTADIWRDLMAKQLKLLGT